MKKTAKRGISLLIAMVMLLGVVMPAGAVWTEEPLQPETPVWEDWPEMELNGDDLLPDSQEQAETLAAGEYEIYPTPHSVTYADPAATVTLPATMQVVYESGIDQYTKARAVEAFEAAGVTLNESGTTAIKLQVGIEGSNGAVDTYFNSHNPTTANLFTKNDAYQLLINADGVAVLGKDTDAAFYGLTTVKRIMQQVTDKQVKHLTVEDWSDVAFRGFIEGYYGNPWSVEDRVDLMKFGGEYKMNIYFYAPKDDPKHNAQWRELYTQNELDTIITPLAQAGNESKCYFGFALHPFMNSPISFSSDAAYEADLEILKAKFLQVIQAGVRQIAVLADDAAVPTGGGSSYVRLINDLTEWVSSNEMQTQYPGLKTSIPFCPADYGHNYNDNPQNGAELDALKNLPATAPIIMTGGAVYGTVNNDFLSAFHTKMGRGSYLWINWPCSDNSKMHLMMRGQDKFLKAGVNPEYVEGIMLNPMQQSEPSKVGIFCNADYAWNIWEEEQQGFDAWADAYKYLEDTSGVLNADQTAAADAFRELSKHMTYNIDGRPPKTAESEELQPKLTALLAALSAGTATEAQITELETAFTTLQTQAATYKEKGKTRVKDQIIYWLDCWQDFTQANLDLLAAARLSLNNADGSHNNEIVTKYLSGQQNLKASQSHSFWYRDHYENAEVGHQRLVPFTNNLLTHVSTLAKTILDPTVLVETIITSRTDTPTNGLEAMRDGDEGTAAIFKSPDDIAANEYVGVQYNRPITLNEVRFELGESSNANNTFNGCKLQYLNADNVWTDIEGATAAHDYSGNANATTAISATGLNLQAKGVRVIATEAKNTIWLGIKEIYINGKSGGGDEPAVETITATAFISENILAKAGDLTKVVDSDMASFIHLARNPYEPTDPERDHFPAGGFVGIDLGEAKAISHISILQGSGDKLGDGVLEYSNDNTTYTEIASGLNTSAIEQDVDITARYIRLRSVSGTQGWLQVYNFAATPKDINRYDKIAYQSESVKSLIDPVGQLTDTSASLAASGVILKPGEFVGIALPEPRRIVDIVADYTHNPNIVLKVGMNEQEMEIVDLSQTASLMAVGRTGEERIARFVRLENVGTQTTSFVLNELSVQSSEAAAIRFDSSTIGGASNSEDARATGTTGNWFDGDLGTSAKFCATQVNGQDVIYDLGKTRDITNLRLYVVGTELDYIRHGKVQISTDKTTWTDVITVDCNADGDTAASAAGLPWTHDTGNPNNYFVEDTITATPARYIRVVFTASFGARWLRVNEIMINGGEYFPMEDDPSLTASPREGAADFVPSHLTDGDYTSAFKPGTAGEGSISYRLSDFTSVGQINVLGDAAARGALVSVRTDATNWQTLDTRLGDGLTEVAVPEDIANVLEVKIAWTSGTPTLYELIPVERAQVASGGGQASSDTETVPINSYSGDGVINFDENWKFNLGDDSGASAQVYNDASWRTVNLPHDFSIEQDYTPTEAESGYLPGGTGWYRKSFTVDSSWANKTVTIDFGGAYMDTEVYLNGTKLGEHHYGYTPFSFVLSNLNTSGENVIAVKVTNTVPSSRWYSGSGLYRSVHLTASDKVHVAKYGTKVETTNAGAVTVKTTVQNDGTAAANVTVKQEIFELNGATYEPQGSAVARVTTDAAQSVANGASHEFTQTLNVTSPKIWNSWDKGTPNLYQLKTTVLVDGTAKSTYTTEFGFRTIGWDANTGFKLNGANLKLKGVCQHHDQGALGAEAWYRALERQVEILKEMGCNAIRVTHNPAADELIEICNRKGMLIIDEAFDGWLISKNGNSNDFARHFNTQLGANNHLVGKKTDSETWAQVVLETMVNRDKNAPCVIMYSLGNEIQEGAGINANYVTAVTNMIRWAKDIDSTRYLTIGDNTRSYDATEHTGSAYNDFNRQVNTKIAEAGGAIGFNYAKDTSDRNAFPTAHSTNANWLYYSSETASHTNSRGVYDRKGSNGDSGKGDKLVTSYDKSAVGWGDTANGAWWYVINQDYNAGEFVWTGFDYIGEPTPWNGTTMDGWKAGADSSPKSSYFGIIDTNGLPKDNYYLYRSMWNEKAGEKKTLHLLPTWDETDVVKDSNGKVEVVVYSNAPVVKLYLNGTEVGTATITPHATEAGYTYRTFDSGTGAFVRKTGDESLFATFNVTYAAGTLEVKAFEANGTTEITDTVGRSVVKTTSGASKLRVAADRSTIQNDGRDLSYITIDVTDANGNIVNSAKNDITVKVTGEGKLVGLDNGVQPDHTSYQADHRKAGAGQLVAIVQSTKTAGTFTLTATADGLTPASVTVTTSGAAQSGDATTPASYDIPKNFYVQLNTEPELPTKATVTMTDGTTKVEKNVTWSTYDKTQLATAGNSFAISGVIDQGGLNIPISVSVTVLDTVAALLNYSAAVQVGATTANLPVSRPAVMADGTVLTAQFPVTWATEPSYAQEGTYVVNGTADVFGQTMNVTATIRVSAGEIHEGSNVMRDALPLTPTTAADLTALRDDDGNTAVTVAENGSIAWNYDTAQGLYKVAVTYKGSVPAVGPTISVGNNITDFTPRTPADTTTSGNTVTYTMDAVYSAVAVKLTFLTSVQVAGIEMIDGTSSFTVNSTAELDNLQLNGQDATEAQMTAKEITTPSMMADVTPVSSSNVAVTILPETDNVIYVVTESEDHTARDLYTVRLGCTEVTGADDASFDYPYGQTTAYAPSAQNGTPDGPDDWAVDGDENTYWHSAWSSAGTGDTNLSSLPEKRYIQLTLNEATELVALRYKGRNGNGFVTGYEVWVSNAATVTDGSKDGFTKVAEGTWTRDSDWKIAKFEPVTAKYVRLYGASTYGDSGNNKFMSCAELRVVKSVTGTDISPAAVTVTPAQQYWTNQAVEPENVTVTLFGQTLTQGTDYTLRFANNVNAGTADVYVDGMGDYYGSAHGTFTIVKVDAEVTGFDAVNVTTREGTAPVLPDTVTAHMSGGPDIQQPVTWDTVSADKYQNVEAANKTFTVQGTVAGTDVRPTANVTVALAQTVDSVVAVTVPNVTPSLPATVTVHFDDSTEAACPVTWALDGVSFDTVSDTPVAVTGTIAGIRLQAQASVRVTAAVPSDTNFALNTNYNSNIFPFALSYWCSGNNNPYQAINNTTTGTDASTRWSDWERDTHHTSPKAWMGVAFETSTEGVTRAAGTTLSLNTKLVNKVKVEFVDEGGGTTGAVTFPQEYEIQYYTGPVTDLTFDTTLSSDRNNAGNGRVRSWTNSPLLNDANWQTVTYKGAKPAVVETNGTMLTVEFNTVQTAIIRVLCTAKADKWTGIEDLEVYGLEIPVPNSDFEVSSIMVGGTNRLSDFDANKSLSIVLDPDAAIPAVTAQATKNATVSVTPAAAVPGSTVITITSEDGSYSETYTIHFTRAPRLHTITMVGSKAMTISATSAYPGTTITMTLKEGYLLARLIVTAKNGDSVSVSNNSFVMPDSDVTVNVSAPAIPYTITYDLDGGKVKTDNPTTYTVESETITLNAPTKSGYTFNGWTGTGLTSATKTVTIPAGSIGDRTYTATWTKNSSGDTPAGPGGPGGGFGGGSGSRPPIKDTDANGVVSATVTDPRTGAVTETVTYPDGGKSITVTQKDGSSTRTVTNADGSRSVASTVPGEGTTIVVTDEIGEEVAHVVLPEVAPEEEKQFGDIPQDHWAANSIGKVAAMGLFVGDEKGNFMGNARMNRGMMATVLHRISGELKKRPAEFADVRVGAYYAEAVDWASDAGIIRGVGENRYAPDQDITRQELATMMYRYAKFLGVDTRTSADALTAFPDRAELGGWATEAMNWAVSTGLFQGRGADLAPQGHATRAEVATILSRFVELLK